MKSASSSVIEKYCEYTRSKFISYSNGLFTFKSIFGGFVSFTQNDLIKTVRSFQ